MRDPSLRRRLLMGGAASIAAVAVAPFPLPSLAAAAEPRKARKPAPPQRSPRQSAPVPTDDAAPDIVTYGSRSDVLRLADDIAARNGFDAGWVRAALADARFLPAVARLVMPAPAGAAKNWAAYRSRFVEPVRVQAGAAFWRANSAWLGRAEERWGVPPEIVVAIVGVESIYGRQMGTFRVIDALATLAFDYPFARRDRTELFQGELDQWFVLCQREGVDPLAWRGSYAGAIGMAQFLPSSINRYAIDFDGDGHVDLIGSAADTIGSIAHYLAAFGWVRGLPVRVDARPPTETTARATLLAPDILPTFTAAQLADAGAVLGRGSVPADEKLALVELQNGAAAPSFYAGTSNFYAITRYNWSSYYAMAVYELGAAVRAAMG